MESDPSGVGVSLLEAALRLRDETDSLIEGRLRVLPDGQSASCRAGCAACCYQLVVISPMEAHAIAAFVRERPALEAALENRLAAWTAAVAACPTLPGLLERFEEAAGYMESEEGAELERQYWEARLPCPFLEGDRCSVYPVRPFGCREHHVVSDAALCSQDLDAPTPAGTRLETRFVANWAGSTCFGLPDRVLLLPEALDHAEAHPEEAERRTEPEALREAVENSRRRARMALAALRLAGRGRSQSSRGWTER